MVLYQGEQYTQYIGGDNIDPNVCEQVLLAVVNESRTKRFLLFGLTPIEGVEFDGDVQVSDDDEYEVMVEFTSEMTRALVPGKYFLEAARELPDGQVIKDQVELFTIVKSYTVERP